MSWDHSQQSDRRRGPSRRCALSHSSDGNPTTNFTHDNHITHETDSISVSNWNSPTSIAINSVNATNPFKDHKHTRRFRLFRFFDNKFKFSQIYRKPFCCTNRRTFFHSLQTSNHKSIHVHVSQRRKFMFKLFMIVCIYIIIFFTRNNSSSSLRVPADTLRNQASDSTVPLLIPSLASSSSNAGNFNSQFPSFASMTPLSSYRKKKASYGGIHYIPLSPHQNERYIQEESTLKSLGHVYASLDFEDENDDSIDNYYAFDDDHVRHPTCRRVTWHRMYHPNCNTFHETDMTEISYMNHGYYRDVWASSFDEDGEVDMVMKSMRLKHKYRYDHYEFTRMDALVMERLTSSPNIVDIYGHCAVSVLTEALSMEIESRVISENGYLSGNPLNDKDDVDPKNNFTPTEKLILALEMAEAIAELHGFKDGVIVHDDIQLCQFLRSKDGTLKLNDFNRAELMLWDENNQEYCKYNNGLAYGNVSIVSDLISMELFYYYLYYTNSVFPIYTYSIEHQKNFGMIPSMKKLMCLVMATIYMVF